jgi:hypothetical protein
MIDHQLTFIQKENNNFKLFFFFSQTLFETILRTRMFKTFLFLKRTFTFFGRERKKKNLWEIDDNIK